MTPAAIAIATALVLIALWLLARRRPNAGLLALALVVLALTILATFTPALWIAMGRPADTYPEWLGVLYGMPASALLLLAAAIRGWMLWRRAKASAALRALSH